MKRLILVTLLLGSGVQAQIIECPKFYPWEDTPLAEVPHQHKGKGFIAKARLEGASMYTGAINGHGELQGDRNKVKGGWDVRYGFESADTRWLVCSYGGGDITWWEQLDSKTTSCKLEIREMGRDPKGVKLTCK
jgi:hypothetical protein